MAAMVRKLWWWTGRVSQQSNKCQLRIARSFHASGVAARPSANDASVTRQLSFTDATLVGKSCPVGPPGSLGTGFLRPPLQRQQRSRQPKANCSVASPWAPQTTSRPPWPFYRGGPVFAQAMCLRESGAPSAASCAVKFRQAKKIFKAMKTSTCQTALSLMMRMRGRCRNLHALRNDIHIEVFNRFVVSMHYTQTWCGGFGNGLLLSIILKHGDWHLCQSPDPSPFPQSSI